MPEEYDDSRPTHRWVRIGYAVKDGRIDRDRIGKYEELPVAEAKALVAQGHATYLTDEQIAEGETVQAEAEEQGGGVPVETGGAKRHITPAEAADQPAADQAADPRSRVWGAGTASAKPAKAAKAQPTPSSSSTTTSSDSKE